MSHKKSMEMPLTARNVVRVISTKRAVYAREGFLRAQAFASVKNSKKKGLPGILRLVLLARLP